MRHHGANYMFFDGFSSAAGTLLLSKFVAQEVYDEHIDENHEDPGAEGSNFKCFGAECVSVVCFASFVYSTVVETQCGHHSSSITLFSFECPM